MAPAADVELTDALLEQYVQIAQEIGTAGQAGNLGVLTRYGWSYERWATVAAKVGQGVASAGRAQYGEAAGKALQDSQQRMQEIEAKLAGASDEERQALQLELDGLRAMQGAIGGMGGEASELDKRNMEVLQRWLPKLQALDQGK